MNLGDVGVEVGSLIKWGRSKRSRTQNNEGHKSQFPPYNSSIPPMVRGGNPAHYLNWWFPAHITAQSLSRSCLYATHFICRCACSCRKWRFVIGHIRPKPNKRTRERSQGFPSRGSKTGDHCVRMKTHIWRAGIGETLHVSFISHTSLGFLTLTGIRRCDGDQFIKLYCLITQQGNRNGVHLVGNSIIMLTIKFVYGTT